MERLNYRVTLKYHVGRLTGAGILAIAVTVAASDNAFAQRGGVRGDFNGDQVADLAIGAPGEDFQGQEDAGVVHVVYGSNAGLQATGVGGPPAQLWSQASPGVGGLPERLDNFGWSLAVADFNGDGFADLAIGAYGENGARGVVHVLYGSSVGLQAAGFFGPLAQTWSQSSAGVEGVPEPSDYFGWALSAGDLNGDEVADLAIGAPLEGFQGQSFAGVVHVLYGSSPVGLQATGAGGPAAQLWSQASPGLGAVVEGGDIFGWSLTIAHFNGDAFADLAIGVPNETDAQGVVHVLYGSSAGLQTGGRLGPAAQTWSQASPGVADAPESGDAFGWVSAAGDVNGDGITDLVIGVPHEDFQGQADAGVVHVLYGSGAGLQATGVGGPPAQLWSQASDGVLDGPEPVDWFGWALAVGDLDGDGFADLAIGAPGENNHAGVVHILRGSNVGLHVFPIGVVSLLWSQASIGGAGGPEPGDVFGFSLAVADFNGDAFADLAIGAPGENGGQGVVHVLYGSNMSLQPTGLGGSPAAQLWSQASPGVAGGPEHYDFFGYALGSR